MENLSTNVMIVVIYFHDPYDHWQKSCPGNSLQECEVFSPLLNAAMSSVFPLALAVTLVPSPGRRGMS